MWAFLGVLICIALAFVAPLWAAVFAVVLIAAAVLDYGRAQLSTRPCPRCGARVEKGVLECEACGFDFRSIGNEVAGETRER